MDGESTSEPPPITETISTVADVSIEEHENMSLLTTNDTLTTNVNKKSPGVIKRVLPRSPSTPRTNSELTPSRRDYKVLYEELKRKTLDYSKTMEAKFETHQKEYDALSKKCEILKNEYEEKLATKQQFLKETLAELDNLKNAEEQKVCFKRTDDEEFVRTRPRRKGKNNTDQQSDPLNCQYADCGKTDEDAIIKCNLCNIWVCEECHDVSILKLKLIMNKCKTVYFTCKTCNLKTLQLPEEISPAEDKSQFSANNIDTKFEAFSANIISKVTEIMDMKIAEITKASPINHANIGTPPTVTWSSVVSQSSDMETVMRAARNNEKIEESEKQRRANNIILHGAEEIGDTPNEIKEADTGYIKEILSKIGAKCDPSSITRLGAPREDGMRPIKLVMRSIADKETVMKNVRKLKNTERYFGKISLKDDHTSNEREQIRILTNEAAKKRDENPDRDFRVRGDSKNGWRIVSFLKK